MHILVTWWRELVWLVQAVREERQMRIIQLYRQTAKKEHANILRRRQIIEDRKEELEYINTQRVCLNNCTLSGF